MVDFFYNSGVSQLTERVETIVPFNAHYHATQEDRKKTGHPTAMKKDCADKRRKDIIQFMILQNHLIRGSVRFMSALRGLGAFILPQYPYGSEELRFNQRFEPFIEMTVPAPLYYEQFTQNTDFKKFGHDLMLNGAIEAFTQAQKIIQPLCRNPDPEDDFQPLSPSTASCLLRLVISQIVSIRKLLNMIPNVKPTDGDENGIMAKSFKTSFDFSLSTIYPVMTVVDKQTKK